jgi:hypothetical protein
MATAVGLGNIGLGHGDEWRRRVSHPTNKVADAQCNVILLHSWAFGPMLEMGLMTLHHHGGEAHPSPRIAPSLLRLSAARRLALAAVLIVLIWAAALWAMS